MLLFSLREKLFRSPRFLTDENHKAALEHQRSRDLFFRQIPGVVFYPLAWFLISLIVLLADFSFSQFKTYSIWLIVFILAAVFRYITLLNYKKLFLKETNKGLVYLYLGIALSAGSWGVMVVVALFTDGMKENLSLILAATFGLCSGGTISLAISRKAMLCFLICMLIPLCMASLFFDSGLGRGFSVLVLIYFFGMYGLANIPKREYELMVVSNLKLSDQTKQLTQLTMQDGLTGINNRRYFDEMFITEISRASRLNYSLVLLLIDVDYFKMINDEYGHLTGDACLERIAHILSENTHRKTDILARYGGEEFVLVLTDMGKDEGLKYAEQIRLKIEETEIEEIAHQQFSKKKGLTISIGGVNLNPQKNTLPENIIKAADDALYKAKDSGRNRVCWKSL